MYVIYTIERFFSGESCYLESHDIFCVFFCVCEIDANLHQRHHEKKKTKNINIKCNCWCGNGYIPSQGAAHCWFSYCDQVCRCTEVLPVKNNGILSATSDILICVNFTVSNKRFVCQKILQQLMQWVKHVTNVFKHDVWLSMVYGNKCFKYYRGDKGI